MIFTNNIAGLDGKKQIKVAEMDDKKLKELTSKPIVLTEDEAIEALQESTNHKIGADKEPEEDSFVKVVEPPKVEKKVEAPKV